MKEKNLQQQTITGAASSNIIFGTSSDDIQQGLDHNQFVEDGGDEDQIVNEQEQNEIVNPSEETFNEGAASQGIPKDITAVAEQPQHQLEENIIDLAPDKEDIDKSGKITTAED